MKEELNPLNIISELFTNSMKLIVQKNNDYAGKEEFFKNLSQCEGLEICSTEQGILVRLSDKFSRLSTLLGNSGVNQLVKDESVDDTIKDVINYCSLLYAYRKINTDTTNKEEVVSNKKVYDDEDEDEENENPFKSEKPALLDRRLKGITEAVLELNHIVHKLDEKLADLTKDITVLKVKNKEIRKRHYKNA